MNIHLRKFSNELLPLNFWQNYYFFLYCANYIPFIMLFATILYHPEKIADVYSA